MAVSEIEKQTKEVKQDGQSEDLQIVLGWTEKAIGFNYDSILTLQECYDSYRSYIVDHHNRLPLTKRKFSETFKQIVSAWVSAGQVRIHDRSKVLFEGLTFADRIKKP